MVFGSGCILDTSRFIRCVADYLNLSTGVINGYLAGEHGDNQVPVWRKLVVSGTSIEEYCQEVQIPWNDEVKVKIAEKIHSMGTEIIKAKGKTHSGIATSVCFIADAIINQRPTIVSVSSQLMGEHGVRGVSLFVPSVIGPGGTQQRTREKWNPNEYRGFYDVVEKVRKILSQL